MSTGIEPGWDSKMRVVWHLTPNPLCRYFSTHQPNLNNKYMSDARIYKNRRLTLTHLSDELFDGRVVCAAHVAIQPGLIAADFDMVGGIGDDEQTAKRDAFRRAMALIEYKDREQVSQPSPTLTLTAHSVFPLEARIRWPS